MGLVPIQLSPVTYSDAADAGLPVSTRTYVFFALANFGPETEPFRDFDARAGAYSLRRTANAHLRFAYSRVDCMGSAHMFSSASPETAVPAALWKEAQASGLLPTDLLLPCPPSY